MKGVVGDREGEVVHCNSDESYRLVLHTGRPVQIWNADNKDDLMKLEIRKNIIIKEKN